MARLLSISVPDKIYDELQKNKDISVSAVCQKALREALASENKLAEYGAQRLHKEIQADWETYREKCFKAGQEWAAREASLRELECAFEENIDEWAAYHPEEDRKETGAMWMLSEGFFMSYIGHIIPAKLLEEDSNNELFWNFFDGANDIWKKIKTLLTIEK